MDELPSMPSQNTLTSKKLKKIPVPPFNSEVWLYRGKYEDFLEILAKENKSVEGNYDGADGLTFNFGVEQVIWLDQNAPNAVKMHELLHAVLNICDEHNLDRTDDELLCYLLEYLVKSS